jgi:hypothetical protein
MFIKINNSLINLNNVYQIDIESDNRISLYFTDGEYTFFNTDVKEFISKIQSLILKPGSISIKSFLKDELI